MEFICQCPNGHRLRVEDHHRGHRVRCRKCRVVFEAPRQVHQGLTESAVLRILGDFDPDETLRPATPRAEPFAMRENRHCPRCRTSVDTGLRICPNCNLYLTGLPDAAAG